MEQKEAAAADPGRIRFDDGQCRGDRNGRIERIPACLQDFAPRRGCRRMCRGDRGTRRHRKRRDIGLHRHPPEQIKADGENQT
jgi:hypothetical protein